MFKETDEDKYGSKCICGHFRNSHHYGPIKEEKDSAVVIPDLFSDDDSMDYELSFSY